MSKQCKVIEIPLLDLRPRWVQFNSNKGVLRCLNHRDPKELAQGVIFNCPRCRNDKQKEHYCIFLFDLPSVPEEARPHGRFVPNWESVIDGKMRPKNFHELSLWMLGTDRVITSEWLRPGDMACKWAGSLQDGVVSYRPNWMERLLKK